MSIFGAQGANTWVREMQQTLRLGAPLALGELGWMSTYIVDALMIGRLPASYSPLAQASALLGNTIFYAVVFSAIYLLNGLETLIAQAYGQDRREECLHLLAQSAWIILFATPLVMLLSFGSLKLLPLFGTPHEVIVETGRYMRPLVLSTLPLMLYMALRRYLQSINSVVWVTASLLTAAAINCFGDWVFLLGRLGVPSLGIAGSAWGTLLVRVYTLALLILGAVIATRRLDLQPEPGLLRPDWPRLRALLRIGWPSGLENLAEFGVFAAALTYAVTPRLANEVASDSRSSRMARTTASTDAASQMPPTCRVCRAHPSTAFLTLGSNSSPAEAHGSTLRSGLNSFSTSIM